MITLLLHLTGHKSGNGRDNAKELRHPVQVELESLAWKIADDVLSRQVEDHERCVSTKPGQLTVGLLTPPQSRR